MNVYKMKNNHKVFAIIGLVGLLYFSCKPAKISTKDKAPNFILILTDDQGWNGTSVQMMDNETWSKSDYHHTPNVEALANRGCDFLLPMPVLQYVLLLDTVFNLGKHQLDSK